VRPAHVEEDTAGEPAAVAETNARRKAAAIPGALVLGADTVVALDGELLGKPDDAAQARDFVGRLNGRTHEVVGGIALVERDDVVGPHDLVAPHDLAGADDVVGPEHGELVVAAVEITKVTFRRADAAALDWYVATGEWQGRAGGYAIQGAGAALVATIEGDYLNVVGLPLARLLDLRPDLLPAAR
jgi:septum formation protein